MECRLVRTGAAAALVLLALIHGVFALTNFGFVADVSRDWATLLEGIGSTVAALSLAVAAFGVIQRRQPWGVILWGTVTFLVAMAVSVAMGSSDVGMLVATLILPIVATSVLLFKRMFAN